VGAAGGAAVGAELAGWFDAPPHAAAARTTVIATTTPLTW
jgi:hypothetical protein